MWPITAQYYLQHVLVTGVGRDHVVVGQLSVLHTGLLIGWQLILGWEYWLLIGWLLEYWLLIGWQSSAGDLPHDEAEAVHVCRLEALEAGGVDGVIKDLRGHVPPRAHPEQRSS